VFYDVSGARGALLIGFFSLVGRSLLIRDRESALWLSWFLGFGFVLFWWIGGCGCCMFIRLGAFRMWLSLSVEVWSFILRGVLWG